MEKERKLTWKYFWEQKSEELRNFFLWLGAIFIVFNIGFLFVEKVITWRGEMASDPFLVRFIVGGTIGLLLLFLIGVMVFLIARGMKEWIKDNWKQAKRRARREVKNDN